MKLIIDIDENVFTRLFDNGIQDNEISVDDICEMARALRLGKPLLEEFKKIKAEIMATGNWKSEYEISDRGVIKAVEIIDNHISELKGENEQSRCNNCQNNTDELSGECYECIKGIEDWYEPISELKGENQ